MMDAGFHYVSVYNYLGRKRIAGSSSSDGLHEMYAQAKAERYADAQETWHYDLNDEATDENKSQEEARSSWVSQMRSPSCPQR